MNGEPFEVPVTATGWRVRRMKHKGAPEVVYGRDGLPLVLPLEADVEDLRREVETPGRYRVDPVDGHRPIANAPAGYVVVHNDGSNEPRVAATANKLPAPSDNVVIEAMRMNAEIARAVVEKFPLMLEASATLLRAADGAGLPSRQPRLSDELDDGDGDDDTEPAEKRPAFDLHALATQLIPVLAAALGNVKMPGLGEILDWRKAATAATSKAKPAKTAKAVEAAEVVPENATDVLPPIDPQTMAHFIAVQSALAPEEAAIAREVAKELSAAELRAWFDELSKLAVPDAVAKVRKLIAGHGKNGSAS
ncbi:MAG: hypothetical protein KF773_12265 [Deltaproteobacteria bacterium]|nr:hypothetical protein [Deltaproteobacteria bacterium]